MPDDETPPPGPSTIPTIGSVARQLQGLAGQLHGARNDIDALAERVRLVQVDAAELRKRLPDTPAAPSASITPAPRPSLAVKAGQTTINLGKWSAIVLGALAVAGQIAAQFRPGYVGPIQLAIRLLGGQP